MFELIKTGGPVMIPIIGCSVLALAIFLERLYFLQTGKILPSNLVKKVKDLVQQEKLNEAIAVCEENGSSLAHVLAAGLKCPLKQREILKERIEETGQVEAASLERFIEVLGTIASISPLLGLLGTVTGLISIFDQITTRGTGDPQIFAGGIGEALITTAAGLIVAIPVFVAYRFLQSRANKLIHQMEMEALIMVDMLTEKNTSPRNM